MERSEFACRRQPSLLWNGLATSSDNARGLRRAALPPKPFLQQMIRNVPVSVLTIDTPCRDSPACPLRLRLDQLLRAEVTRRLGSRRNEVVPSTGTCSIQFFFRTR